MKILIVDDEPLARRELSYIIEQIESDAEIVQANSIVSAMSALLSGAFDLVFLDIHLQDENGLDLAEYIGKMPNPPLIIFATAYDEYAVRAFQLNAQDYILKPFEEDRIQVVLERAKARLEEKNVHATGNNKSESQGDAQNFQIIPVQDEDRIFLVASNEIIMVAVEGGELTLYTRRQKYTSRESLKAFKSKLPESLFLQVHRAYVINRLEIKEIQPWFNHTYQLTMSNGEKVQVSRSYIPSFREAVGLN